jgi:hypothetical protein
VSVSLCFFRIERLCVSACVSASVKGGTDMAARLCICVSVYLTSLV